MSYNVLIVDRSASVRAVIKRTLRDGPMAIGSVHEAGSGEEALDVLSERRVDLVLADPNLPEMDGVDLIGRILSEPQTRHVRVIVLSANKAHHGPHFDRLRQAGAKAILRKSVSSAKLHEVLSQVLEPTHV